MSARAGRRGLALAGAAVGAGFATWFSLDGQGEFVTPHAIALWLAIGWSFIGSGLVAWARRPGNRTGPLMAAAGFCWFASGLTTVDASVPFTVGSFIQALYIVVFGHLVLAFPGGRLESVPARAVIIAGYLDVTVLNGIAVLFAGPEQLCDVCPDNAALVWDRPSIAEALFNAERGIGAVCAVAAIGIVVARLQRTPRAARRLVAPVLAAGGLAFALLILSLVNDSLERDGATPLGTGPQWAFWLVFLCLPLAFLAGLLRVRLQRAAVADLLVDLQAGGGPDRVQEAIADALGDSSVVVGYWLPGEQRFVGADGRRLDPEPAPGRATTTVELDGRRIAALDHDGALADEPELLEAVSAAAALTLENARLTAELRARLEELRQERDFISTVLETAPTLVCVLTSDGRILSFNAACERLSGYTSEEVAGRAIWDVVIPAEEAAGVRGALSRASTVPEPAPVEHENRWRSRSGEERVIAWLNTAIVAGDGSVEYLVCAGLDVTERRRQEEELRRLHAELEARLEELRASRARIVEATDSERRRVERNLHDGAQQRLVSVSMALGLTEAVLASGDEARARAMLAEARESLGAAISELREISQGIHPSVLTERGLGVALRELAYSATFTVDLSVDETRLPEGVEAAAYYVVAEALANVGKHAQATRAQVVVARDNGSVRVAVADDGIGGADPNGGTGLRGLADRVEALGGALEVDSAPGRGTRIHVEIPCAS